MTKYTSLKSFYAADSQSHPYEPLSYENAGTYTTALQDAYLYYKSLFKELQLLGSDVSEGKKTLKAAEPQETLSAANESTSDKKDDHSEKSVELVDKPVTDGASLDLPKAHVVHEPYAGTILGLEKAKRDVRIMMGRIVREVSDHYQSCSR